VVYVMGWLSTRLGYSVPLKFRHIMFWGGLRGAVSLALALSLHGSYAGQVQLMTFGVVLFTLLVQGLTIEPLINRLRLANMVRTENEQTHLAQLEMLRASRRELDNLRDGGLIAEPTWRVLTEITEDDVQTILHEHPNLERTILIEARREMLRAKRTALSEALQRGVISDAVYHRQLHELDRRLLIWDELAESFEQPPRTAVRAREDGGLEAS
jgi:CPA1 family monovalent cation:H+ antiporter